MNLQSLLSSLQEYEAHGPRDLEISGLAYDSRHVEPGNLFAALPGVHQHGIQFLKQAEDAGASALLTDHWAKTSLMTIVVKDARFALASLSNRFYDQPSSRLKLIGVTGTNGKTTSTFLLQSILQNADVRSGLIGTIQYSATQFRSDASLTTPESLDLQRLLARMVAENCAACVMEVSSHSLIQHRVASCLFEAAIFTNLTQDHLDYHHTMENYFQAKRLLFSNETCRTKIAVVNYDDPYGQRILAERKASGFPVVSFGFHPGADFPIHDYQSTSGGTVLKIRHDTREWSIESPLIARYNAYNICGAFAAALSLGIQDGAIVSGIKNMKQVPGRLEKIDFGQPFLIFIDYAHTEDALRQLLNTLRTYTANRLIVVFGCGGERDRGKRPMMGEVAASLADEVILTSDNPRNEDPDQIIADVLPGIRKTGNEKYHIIPDREEAVAYAVKLAKKEDTLVLAGKGHETYQIIGNEKVHFDEREILRKLLS